MNKNIIVVLLILFSQNIFSYRQRLAYDIAKLTYEEKAHFVKSHLFYMRRSIEITLKINNFTKLEISLIDKYNKIGKLPFVHNRLLNLIKALSMFTGVGFIALSFKLYPNIPAKLPQFKKIQSALDAKRSIDIIKFLSSSIMGIASIGMFDYGIYSENYFNTNTLNIANKGNAIDWTYGRAFWIRDLIESDPDKFKDIIDYKILIDFLDKFNKAYNQEFNNIGLCAIGMDFDWAKFYKDLTLAN